MLGLGLGLKNSFKGVFGRSHWEVNKTSQSRDTSSISILGEEGDTFDYM